MAKVKNTSPGPRTVQAKLGNDQVETITLRPGEEREIDLVNEDDPVLQGMVKNRELLIGSTEEKELSDEERRALDEEKFRTDPHLRDNRERAQAAGNTPGYADPLPEGTDTEGGEEAAEARRNAGVDDDGEYEEQGGEDEGAPRRRVRKSKK